MCSVKIRPKPGFASRRSRSATGRRSGTWLMANLMVEVRELTLLPTVTNARSGDRGGGEAEPCDPASREEGRGSGLERRRADDRDGDRDGL